MDVTARRRELLRVLCSRRFETVSALAGMFGVSPRTVLRDVEAISLYAPIYTRQGRHGGGIYLVDGYQAERLYLSADELSLLSGLLSRAERIPGLLPADEGREIRALISRYTRPARQTSGDRDTES